MNFIKYIFLLPFVVLSLFTNAQVIYNHNTAANNLDRIDSLTLEYMRERPPRECNSLCIDGLKPSDEEMFMKQMNSLGSEIIFNYNEHVLGQISYFGYAEGAFLRRAYVNRTKYFPIFEETLDKKGVPQELKYISIIESALNPTARSRAGAMGLWQFMPGTGKWLDMTINYSIDERKSIIKSTETAADYFKSLHNMFGDWLLAIAAYNGGPGTVQKAINRAGGVGDFWHIKNYLPKETQNYVPRFIAAVYLMNFSNAITSTNTPCTSIYCPIDITDTLDFKELCRYTKIENEELRMLNAQFQKDNLKGNASQSYQLLLPYEKAMTFLEKRDSIFFFSKNPYPVIVDSNAIINADSLAHLAMEEKPKVVPKNSVLYHKVRRGETLFSLSKKYGVTVEEIKLWNKKRSNGLEIGESLLIKRKV